MFLLARENQIIKNKGQYPSIADKERHKINKYRKLNSEVYTELNTAIGLFTHGNGIGSFVYLRRIIEKHIVYPIIEEMLTNNEVKAEDVPKHFDQKLKFCRNHLSEFL